MSAKFVFPLDKKQFQTKASLYSYIEENYSNLLSDDMPPSRLYFNLKYNKTEGKCVMTGKPTKWNNVTEKYERFADEDAKNAYREMFKKRMMSKYGKVHILDSDDQQKKMLSARSISIDYKWADNTITRVNSKLEENFLSFVESIYNFNSTCFTEPPTIYYKNDNNVSFYLPDFYIPSLNLIIEIKGSNPHYQKRDEYKEDLKRIATIKEGFNYIQINDSFYLPFHEFFRKNVIDK